MASYTSDGDFTSESSLGEDEFQTPRFQQPFRFFDLPAELRIHIYEHILVFPRTIDLDDTNYRDIAPQLEMFKCCHQMHNEASKVFYGLNKFRLFPISGRFFHTKKPLLARLPTKYRREMTSLELRLGPGWSKPPRCWTLKARPRSDLKLQECVKLRNLHLFIEVDPSHPIFNGFRVDANFYTKFCGELVGNLLLKLPSIRKIEFDAYPSVSKDAPLMRELVARAKAADKAITWGELSWKQLSAPSAGGLQSQTAFQQLVW